MNADMLNRGTEDRPPSLSLFLFFFISLANLSRRVFGNWSILNFWTLQTAEHVVPCSVAVMLHGL
jgi:hypothetical protein